MIYQAYIPLKEYGFAGLEISRGCNPDRAPWRPRGVILNEPSDTESFGTECPECGRDDFKNRTGMEQHYARTYEGSLRILSAKCDFCGSVFERKRSVLIDRERHYCNQDCKNAWQSENLVGEASPTWNGGLVTVNCANCDDEKEVKPHVVNDNERTFCDPACQGEYQSEHWKGENAPQWNSGLATVICQLVGEKRKSNNGVPNASRITSATANATAYGNPKIRRRKRIRIGKAGGVANTERYGQGNGKKRLNVMGLSALSVVGTVETPIRRFTFITLSEHGISIPSNQPINSGT